MKTPLVIKIKRKAIRKFVPGLPLDKEHFWFTIHGRNGQITSTSETYTRKHNANKTAQTYIDNGLNAVIVDYT